MLALNSQGSWRWPGIPVITYSDYKSDPPHLEYTVTGMKPGALGKLGKHSKWTSPGVYFHRLCFTETISYSRMGWGKGVMLYLTEPLLLKNCLRGFLGWWVKDTHCPKSSYILWLVKALVSFLGSQLRALTASCPLTTLTGGREQIGGLWQTKGRHSVSL